MKLSMIALALPLALSTAAFADSSSSGGSQYQYQTDDGKWNVTPAFTFGSIKTNYNTANSDGLNNATDSLFNFTVGGEYGINKMLSVGLKLGYQTDSFSSSPSSTNKVTASGMTDPDIYLNGRNDVGPGSIRWGTHLTVALGNETLSSDGTKFNEYSGGVTLTPFVGYELNLGPGLLGVRLTYDLYQGDRSIKNNFSGFTDKITGGNNFTGTVFWEMNFDPVIWGVDVGVISHSAAKLNSGAVGETDSTQDGMTNFKIETYAAWTVAPDITILPTIGYTAMGPADYDITEASTGLNVGAKNQGGIYGTVAARFGF